MVLMFNISGCGTNVACFYWKLGVMKLGHVCFGSGGHTTGDYLY